MTDVETFHEATYCPQCGAELSDGPEGRKVYVCPKHGELILTAVFVGE